MKVTVSTYLGESPEVFGQPPIEIYHGKTLVEARAFIAEALRHGPYPPCPYSGYIKPSMRDLSVRFDLTDVPGWSLVCPAIDVTRRTMHFLLH